MSETVDEVIRDIATRPLAFPGPGQHIDRCHYSRTGWAVVNDNGGCTCQPTLAPDNSVAAGM